MELESAWIRSIVGGVIALSVYLIGQLIISKIIKPKKLWWFAICIPLFAVFSWLAFWLPLDIGQNLYVSAIQWGIFGLFLYSFDTARTHWPKGW